MNNNLTFDHYVNLNIDYSNVVNSTLDIENDSILCIELNDAERLDNLILEGLKKGTKLVLTSTKSTIENESVYRYENFEELLNYCELSANPVGNIVLKIFGEFNTNNSELSDRICTGLQLINFIQDINRDSKFNRIYMPIEDIKKFGANEKDILKENLVQDAWGKMHVDIYNGLFKTEKRKKYPINRFQTYLIFKE